MKQILILAMFAFATLGCSTDESENSANTVSAVTKTISPLAARPTPNVPVPLKRLTATLETYPNGAFKNSHYNYQNRRIQSITVTGSDEFPGQNITYNSNNQITAITQTGSQNIGYNFIYSSGQVTEIFHDIGGAIEHFTFQVDFLNNVLINKKDFGFNGATQAIRQTDYTFVNENITHKEVSGFSEPQIWNLTYDTHPNPLYFYPYTVCRAMEIPKNNLLSLNINGTLWTHTITYDSTGYPVLDIMYNGAGIEESRIAYTYN